MLPRLGALDVHDAVGLRHAVFPNALVPLSAGRALGSPAVAMSVLFVIVKKR